jgi:hypothetical protein
LALVHPTIEFYKSRGISWLAEWLLDSQEGWHYSIPTNIWNIERGSPNLNVWYAPTSTDMIKPFLLPVKLIFCHAKNFPVPGLTLSSTFENSWMSYFWISGWVEEDLFLGLHVHRISVVWYYC